MPTIIDSLVVPAPGKFYVYEHWRPDLNQCFWVGKGHGRRAWHFKRSAHYNRVVAKLASLGLCVEVRMVESGLKEAEAFSLERARITFWRSRHPNLTNLTDGGEGISGHRHSEATKRVLAEKASISGKGRVVSEETRRKIGAANAIALKGRKCPEHSAKLKGRTLSATHKAAIAEGLKGRVVSQETREKMKEALSGRPVSNDTKAKLSLSHKGKTQSDETRAKMRVSQKARWGRIKCPQ